MTDSLERKIFLKKIMTKISYSKIIPSYIISCQHKIFDNNQAYQELLTVMLKKIFKEKWFVWTIHFVIVLGLFSNGFYILENFKVSKTNQAITDQKSKLEQDKKNLLDQNSFEFLDSYKDKMVKRAGFKNAGEEVFDSSYLDSKKDVHYNSQELTNYQKWYKCLFTVSFNDNLLDNNQNIVSNNLCK